MSEGDILVIGPSWVGDMVMAQTLFKLLGEVHPESAIDVLAPVWSEPLLDRMPEVRASLTMPVGHGKLELGQRYQLGRSLQGRYQHAIVLPNSLKSALIPFFAGIPHRAGWRGEMRFGLLNDIRLLDKNRYPLMIQRFAALAYKPGAKLPEQLPWPALTAESSDGHRALVRLSLTCDQPLLALCPGAEFGPSKRWPVEHYAQVAYEKIAQGWQVWLFGSANDRGVAEAIVQHLPETLRSHCHNLAGATKLGEAIDLLALADVVVSNDSGLMHIAAALKRPLVVVYGSTSPGFTPPLTDNVSIQSIEVDCGPCFQRECPERHLNCQWGVTPESVIRAIEGLAGASVSVNKA